MLYTKAEERKRARWKKFFFKQWYKEEGEIKIENLRKHNHPKRMRKAQ